MAKPTVLLTGATGFLGSHLLEALLKQGYSMVILKRSTSNLWRIEHLAGHYKSYDVDIQSVSEVFNIEKIDVVIHMATLYRKFDNGSEVSDMLASNVTFPTELLEAGVRKGIKGFINTGTFFEYDCSTLPVGENAKIKPFNFYAKTKLAFEMILSTYSDKLHINTLRLFSPYGEKDNEKLIPYIIKKSILNETIELSDGFQKLDFIYAGDIVEAYLKSLENMQKNNQSSYQVYNIGSGVAISVREVVSVIEQQLGRSIKKQWGAPSKLDIPIAYADISLAMNDFGWRPKHSIHEGMEKTIQYYKESINHVD